MRKGSILVAMLFAGLLIFTATAPAQESALSKNVIYAGNGQLQPAAGYDGLTQGKALSGFSYASADAISDARAMISKIKAEISSREGRILAGDLLIAFNEAALVEAKKKPNNDGPIIVLEITLAGLKSKKNDLIKEKQAWERSLAEWEAHLGKLGG